MAVYQWEATLGYLNSSYGGSLLLSQQESASPRRIGTIILCNVIHTCNRVHTFAIFYWLEEDNKLTLKGRGVRKGVKMRRQGSCGPPVGLSKTLHHIWHAGPGGVIGH